MKRNMNFFNREEAYNAWNKEQEEKWRPELISDLQNDFELEISNFYSSKFKKGRLKNSFDIFNYLIKKGYSDDISKIRTVFEDETKKRHEKYLNDRLIIKKELSDFSKTYFSEPSQYSIKLDECPYSFYHTQTDPRRYAKAHLTEKYVLLNLFGYNPIIKEIKYDFWEGYVLEAYISKFDYDMLRMREFISVLNVAFIIWKTNNANPAVIHPFLSRDDFDKSMFLAYKTDYQITVENMKTELSWNEIKNLQKKIN